MSRFEKFTRPVVKVEQETVSLPVVEVVAKKFTWPVVKVEQETDWLPVVEVVAKKFTWPVVKVEQETDWQLHQITPVECPRTGSLERPIDCASTIIATWRSPEGGAVQLLEVAAKEKKGILAAAFRVGLKILKYKINPLAAVIDLVKVVTDAVTKDDPDSDSKKLHDFGQAQFLSMCNAGL